jgi:hypothetical protein
MNSMYHEGNDYSEGSGTRSSILGTVVMRAFCLASREIRPLMEADVLLPQSQQRVTGPTVSQVIPIQTSYKIRFNIIIRITPRHHKQYLP